MDAEPPPPGSAERVVPVIMNQKAGALLGQTDAGGRLQALLAGAGLTPKLIPTEAGTLDERIALAIATGAKLIVVAGGDGSIACAAQALVGTGVTLGILPSGTMNLLARDLGIPVDDPDAAMRLIAAGSTREIDVAEVNGRVFLCASMLGLPAHLGRHREAQRGAGTLVGRWFQFARAALRTSWTHAARTMLLRVGGTAMPSRAVSVTITANALGDDTGRTFGRPNLDRGEIAGYVIDRLGFLALARLALAALRGHVRQAADVRELRATEVEVVTRQAAVRVMNDGENLLLTPPLRYRIRPRALRVIAPALVFT